MEITLNFFLPFSTRQIRADMHFGIFSRDIKSDQTVAGQMQNLKGRLPKKQKQSDMLEHGLRQWNNIKWLILKPKFQKNSFGSAKANQKSSSKRIDGLKFSSRTTYQVHSLKLNNQRENSDQDLPIQGKYKNQNQVYCSVKILYKTFKPDQINKRNVKQFFRRQFNLLIKEQFQSILDNKNHLNKRQKEYYQQILKKKQVKNNAQQNLKSISQHNPLNKINRAKQFLLWFDPTHKVYDFINESKYMGSHIHMIIRNEVQQNSQTDQRIPFGRNAFSLIVQKIKSIRILIGLGNESDVNEPQSSC